MKRRGELLALALVALASALPAAARLVPPRAQAMAACAAPVEIVEHGRARLECDGGRAALGGRACTEDGRPSAPSAGDRLVLDEKGCRLQSMAVGPRLSLGLRVDLNRASAVDLAALPGIGPRLAERIVAERAAGGPFGSLADLERVEGVGRGLPEALAGVAFAGRGSHP